ncbi:MAG UNVERIFIED_CONTAM: hypothetical protein LVR18_32975 [Planctomycetaceae bacterium]
MSANLLSAAATRSHQFLFLNGRWIQDRSLQHALAEAYRGLLMVGRHPVCFLFLELPPALVDVNVHPNKSEVRFQDGQTLYRQLLKTLRDKFQLLAFQSGIELPTPSPADNNHANPLNNPATTEIRFDRPQPPNRSHQPLNLNFQHGQETPYPRASNHSDPVRSSFNDSAVFHHPGVIKALAVDHSPNTQLTPPPTPQPNFATPMQVAESQILTDEFLRLPNPRLLYRRRQ